MLNTRRGATSIAFSPLGSTVIVPFQSSRSIIVLLPWYSSCQVPTTSLRNCSSLEAVFLNSDSTDGETIVTSGNSSSGDWAFSADTDYCRRGGERDREHKENHEGSSRFRPDHEPHSCSGKSGSDFLAICRMSFCSFAFSGANAPARANFTAIFDLNSTRPIKALNYAEPIQRLPSSVLGDEPQSRSVRHYCANQGDQRNR